METFDEAAYKTAVEIKDEMKKALKRFEQDWCIPPEFAGINYEALAEQGMAIEAEIEHKSMGELKWTVVWYNQKANYIFLDGDHYGTEGKTLLIGVPVEET